MCPIQTRDARERSVTFMLNDSLRVEALQLRVYRKGTVFICKRGIR